MYTFTSKKKNTLKSYYCSARNMARKQLKTLAKNIFQKLAPKNKRGS